MDSREAQLRFHLSLVCASPCKCARHSSQLEDALPTELTGQMLQKTLLFLYQNPCYHSLFYKEAVIPPGSSLHPSPDKTGQGEVRLRDQGTWPTWLGN